ncbi:hypothetical protein [Spiroplasma culicicola]|uniref:Lipoprotein n=1 Tax=Spiroplasma culicicola AES-1 TaxID=1276246 RepID=W6A660_9MOLU|nr:hypothetical protein [Spiroplasma culicicola]AHI52482.1 hypothetical protein SCULI_v1c01410 [Spiroplasma culicicola AES-1]
MKRFINMMTAFTVTVTTVSTATMVVSCKGDYMVKLYKLFPGNNNSWVPSSHDNFLIIEVDKRDIKKYTLHGSETATPYVTRITFYMKDGTINNTNNKWWSGPKSEYEKYFIKELRFGPDVEQE